nr:MAG TPA: hypothetical protein [Caudoviricetes sp.]
MKYLLNALPRRTVFRFLVRNKCFLQHRNLSTSPTVPLFYTAEHWAVTRCMSSSFDNSHAKCTL